MEKFNNAEILRINNEIHGTHDTQTGQVITTGFRHYPLTIATKNRLLKINNAIKIHLEAYESLRKEIITKYFPDGLTPEQEISLQESKDEKYLSFANEQKELLFCEEDEKFEVEFEKISLSKIEDVITKEDFSWLLSKIAE